MNENKPEDTKIVPATGADYETARKAHVLTQVRMKPVDPEVVSEEDRRAGFYQMEVILSPTEHYDYADRLKTFKLLFKTDEEARNFSPKQFLGDRGLDFDRFRVFRLEG